MQFLLICNSEFIAEILRTKLRVNMSIKHFFFFLLEDQLFFLKCKMVLEFFYPILSAGKL